MLLFCCLSAKRKLYLWFIWYNTPDQANQVNVPCFSFQHDVTFPFRSLFSTFFSSHPIRLAVNVLFCHSLVKRFWIATRDFNYKRQFSTTEKHKTVKSYAILLLWKFYLLFSFLPLEEYFEFPNKLRSFFFYFFCLFPSDCLSQYLFKTHRTI